MKAHPGTPETTPAPPRETAKPFDVSLLKSPWHGGHCPGLRRDTKIWRPEETYLEWAALFFPTPQSMRCALNIFQQTETGARCPVHQCSGVLILPKAGLRYMAHLFFIVESPMTSDRPKSSVALYHRACVHEEIMARLPAHTARSPLARKLWFRTSVRRRNVQINPSDTFLVAEALDTEIERLKGDLGPQAIFT